MGGPQLRTSLWVELWALGEVTGTLNTITIMTLGWAEWMAGNCLLSHWCQIGWERENSEGLLDKPGLTTLLWGKEEQEGMGLGDLTGIIPFYLARFLQGKLN